MMKLTLVEKGNFLGTECDFYVNEDRDIFMSRKQISETLQYKEKTSIKNLHKRHSDRLDALTIEVKGEQISPLIFRNGNAPKVCMYTERGIYEICRFSQQKIANDFHSWFYKTLFSIKKNGIYVATEKDELWLDTRSKGKVARRTLTDEIQDFEKYAVAQNSQCTLNYYELITQLINDKLNVNGAKRDDLDQATLIDITVLERIIARRLPKLMNGVGYREVYQEIKKVIEEF